MQTFTINDEQLKKLENWTKDKKHKYSGAIGGRFTYSFTPTSLGMVIKVKDDLLRDEIDLSEYEDW